MVHKLLYRPYTEKISKQAIIKISHISNRFADTFPVDLYTHFHFPITFAHPFPLDLYIQFHFTITFLQSISGLPNTSRYTSTVHVD